LEGPPPKIWKGDKNVQNLAPLMTTFDFDRESYPQQIDISQIGRVIILINYNPFHVGEKEIT